MNRSITSRRGVTPKPGPCDTEMCPSSMTNGSVTSPAKIGPIGGEIKSAATIFVCSSDPWPELGTTGGDVAQAEGCSATAFPTKRWV